MRPGSARAANPAPLVDIAHQCIIPDDIALTRFYELIAPELPGMGVTLDRWQQDIWEVALGLREDGTLCCDVMGVTLSIARQAGKTWGVMVGLVAICLTRPGTLVVWSSHHDRTSSQTLDKIAGIVMRPEVRPKMRSMYPVVATDDNRGVHFANGSKILFGARSSGFGRGFSEVDIQVYDECQNLRESALTDMLAAMNVSEIGLAFFMGTPPRPQETRLGFDEAFRRRRLRATERKKARPYKGVYVEFSPEASGDAVGAIEGFLVSPESPEFWLLLAAANPSYGFRVWDSAIERLVENMSVEDVSREVLGIWDDVAGVGVLPAGPWGNREDVTSIATDRFALGVECGPDLGWASVALAGQRPDEAWHAELVEDQHTMGRGTAWLVPKLQDVVSKNPQIRAVTVDIAGPIASLLEQRGGRWWFRGTRLEVTPVKVAELGAGCALVLDGVVNGWLHHIGQPQLTAAALNAGKRPLGDTGMWVWSRKTAESDITPVQALTLALIGAQADQRKTRKPARPGGRSSSGRQAVILSG